jgi:signal transduction histidine kinase
VGIQSAVLFAFVAEENLEEAGRWMVETEANVRVRSARGDAPERIVEDVLAATRARSRGVAVRLRGPGQEIAAHWGEWPPRGNGLHMHHHSDHRLVWAVLLRKDAHLLGSVRLAGGATLELALPLRHYVVETAEIGRAIANLWLASFVTALAGAALAVSWAFRPLRRATALFAGAPADLAKRLPTRATGDPVDRHAEAVNRTLDALAESFARVRGFSRNIAHELRTPLNRIENVAEVALLAPDDEALRAALQSARDSASGLARVVQSLLLLAEIDDARLAVRPAPIEVEGWLARFADLYGPLFEERGKTLAVSGRAGRIDTDPTLMDRVLVNLVENALEHSSPQARVEVHAQREGDALRLCVDDSGPGIPPGSRERIFERTDRPARTGGRNSFGLGLPLARAIARLLGGDLVALDSPLGGTRFLLRVPLRRAGDARASDRREESALPKAALGDAAAS